MESNDENGVRAFQQEAETGQGRRDAVLGNREVAKSGPWLGRVLVLLMQKCGSHWRVQ